MSEMNSNDKLNKGNHLTAADVDGGAAVAFTTKQWLVKFSIFREDGDAPRRLQRVESPWHLVDCLDKTRCGA